MNPASTSDSRKRREETASVDGREALFGLLMSHQVIPRYDGNSSAYHCPGCGVETNSGPSSPDNVRHLRDTILAAGYLSPEQAAAKDSEIARLQREVEIKHLNAIGFKNARDTARAEVERLRQYIDGWKRENELIARQRDAAIARAGAAEAKVTAGLALVDEPVQITRDRSTTQRDYVLVDDLRAALTEVQA